MLSVKVHVDLPVDEFTSEFDSEHDLKKCISEDCNIDEDSFDIDIEPDGDERCFLSIVFPSPDKEILGCMSMDTLGIACGLNADQIFTISFMTK